MTALALGCSHTAGVGVDPSECYVSLLSKHYQTPIVNTAAPGGSADQCMQHLTQALRSGRPEFVIAQWPNPIRRTMWTGNKRKFETVQSAGPAFRSLLQAGVANFYEPWLQYITAADTMCALAGVPVVHILLEDLATEYTDRLLAQGILLHQDLKIPGQSWIFDSAGADGLHHSAACHAQWANRLIGLIDEFTKR